MRPDAIHETALEDVIDLIVNGVKDVNDSIRKPSVATASSLARASKGLTLVFPVCVSKTLFSACNITNSKDGMDFLKNFHTNLDSDKITVDTFINAMDSYVGENCIVPMVDYKKYKAVCEDLKNLSYFLPDSINETSLGDYKVYSQYGQEPIVIREWETSKDRREKNKDKRNERVKGQGKGMEDTYNQHKADKSKNMKDYTDIDSINKLSGKEAEDLSKKHQLLKNARQTADYDEEKERQKTQDIYYKNKEDRDAAREIRDKEHYEYDKSRRGEEERLKAAQIAKNTQDALKAGSDMLNHQLVSSDVKKANEQVPTMMIVNFVVDKGDGGHIAEQMVIGVKAKLYEIEPNDILTRILTHNTDSNTLLKLVKASTREISFVKDFILGIDAAKLDALSRSKRGSASKLFKTLERRSLKGRVRKFMGKANDAKAITTLVISQEEAEELLKSNMDVFEMCQIVPIMERLNLLCFEVVDETSESVKVLLDGDDMYETLSFSAMEREANDGASKKIVNLMAKVAR